MRFVSGTRFYVKFLVISLATLLISTQAYSQNKTTGRTITLTAEGVVQAKPDLAYISSAVETVDKSAQKAVQSNSEAMAKVISALKAKGIKERDLQTTGFTVSPQYENYGSIKAKRNPEIIAYRVTNNIRITVNKIDDLGSILDEIVQLGSNRINNIAFDVKHKNKLLDKARKQAMKNAIRRAWLYTSAAGSRLGKVISISENTGIVPAPQFANMRAFKSASPVPVQAGSQELTVQVTVSWQIVR